MLWRVPQEQIDEQRLDRRRVMTDLMVARCLRPAQLQPVQRALAGDRRAVGTAGFELAGQDRHHRVVAQLVVVVQIFVAERNAEHALANQCADLVFDQIGAAMVGEAGRKSIHQTDRPVGRSQQQTSRIRGDHAAIERRDNRRPATGANSNSVGLHSVGIGELLRFSKSPSRKRTFANSGPRCTYTV